VAASGAVAEGEADCRLLIHQTVAAMATAATPIKAAIWIRIDPVGVRRSVIPVVSGLKPQDLSLRPA
jgi:hypothetical protein